MGRLVLATLATAVVVVIGMPYRGEDGLEFSNAIGENDWSQNEAQDQQGLPQGSDNDDEDPDDQSRRNGQPRRMAGGPGFASMDDVNDDGGGGRDLDDAGDDESKVVSARGLLGPKQDESVEGVSQQQEEDADPGRRRGGGQLDQSGKGKHSNSSLDAEQPKDNELDDDDAMHYGDDQSTVDVKRGADEAEDLRNLTQAQEPRQASDDKAESQDGKDAGGGSAMAQGDRESGSTSGGQVSTFGPLSWVSQMPAIHWTE